MNAATKTSPEAPRREFRNLTPADLRAYQLPLPGILSILHRASGGLMFLLLPVVLWAFECSLASETSFRRVQDLALSIPARVGWSILAWALLHHLCAGIRFLLLDLHMGVEKTAARRSALWVFAISLPLALIVALKIFGVI